MRVGRILEVEDHPNADKLYVLTVDLGEEKPRTIVAGLREHCKKDHLKGKSAIFLVNLEPATIRGIESQGMILAAISHGHGHHDDVKVCILKPDEEVDIGSHVE